MYKLEGNTLIVGYKDVPATWRRVPLQDVTQVGIEKFDVTKSAFHTLLVGAVFYACYRALTHFNLSFGLGLDPL